jgi:hypothetical protein
MSWDETSRFPKAIAFESNRPDNRWYILPTKALRDLVIRNVHRLKQSNDRPLNYVVCWPDTQGFGLEVAHAEWVGPNGMHIDP